MIISRIRTSYHVAENFEASFEFYAQGLSLPLRFRDGSRWAEFQVGESRFALASPEEAAEEHLGAVTVFQADAMDHLAERIDGYGGVVVGERNMGAHGTTRTVRDPAGVVFQIFSAAQRG